MPGQKFSQISEKVSSDQGLGGGGGRWTWGAKKFSSALSVVFVGEKKTETPSVPGGGGHTVWRIFSFANAQTVRDTPCDVIAANEAGANQRAEACFASPGRGAPCHGGLAHGR